MMTAGHEAARAHEPRPRLADGRITLRFTFRRILPPSFRHVPIESSLSRLPWTFSGSKTSLKQIPQDTIKAARVLVLSKKYRGMISSVGTVGGTWRWKSRRRPAILHRQATGNELR